jgi:hypothetical protein
VTSLAEIIATAYEFGREIRKIEDLKDEEARSAKREEWVKFRDSLPRGTTADAINAYFDGYLPKNPEEEKTQ